MLICKIFLRLHRYIFVLSFISNNRIISKSIIFYLLLYYLKWKKEPKCNYQNILTNRCIYYRIRHRSRHSYSCTVFKFHAISVRADLAASTWGIVVYCVVTNCSNGHIKTAVIRCEYTYNILMPFLMVHSSVYKIFKSHQQDDFAECQASFSDNAINQISFQLKVLETWIDCFHIP